MIWIKFYLFWIDLDLKFTFQLQLFKDIQDLTMVLCFNLGFVENDP